MERKALSKKWKIIICSIALIVAMAGTGITVWAIARNYFRYNADFEVNITGGKYINASVKGLSFLAGSNTALESHTATFNSDTPEQDVDMSFNETIAMQNDEQVAKLRFEVTNNSPYSNHSDLILKPSNTVTDKDDVIITWYYSTNNTNFYVYTGEYLVAHKNDTLYLELRMLATENLYGTVNFTDSITIDLYSEMEEPTDFEWEYEYNYDESTSTATKTRVCPTCGHKENATTMNTNEFMIVTPEMTGDGSGNSYPSPVTITEKITNKVIILNNVGDIIFENGLKNVKICGNTNNTVLALTIEAQDDSMTEYDNITFINYSGSLNIFGRGFISTAPEALVSNLTFIDTVNTSALYSVSNEIVGAENTFVCKNLYLKNCTIKNLSSAKNVFLIGCDGDSISLNNLAGEIYILDGNFPAEITGGILINGIGNNSHLVIKGNQVHGHTFPHIIIENITNSTIEIFNNIDIPANIPLENFKFNKGSSTYLYIGYCYI